MGPEVGGTAILFERSWAIEMEGTDDNDAIYLHDQKAGQSIVLRGSVFGWCEDDGVDTLGSVVTIEDCIVRDLHGTDADAKGISVLQGEVVVDRCLVVDNEVGISAKGNGTTGATVRIDRTTVIGTDGQIGIQAEDKYGLPNLRILYFVRDAIIQAPVAVRSDYLTKFPDDIEITYSDLSQPWKGTGNLVADPLFADALAKDFRLRAGSPCIDAGDPAAAADPDGTRADMGVFPFTHTGPTFVRGRVNGDGEVDLSDAVAVLFHLFAGRELGCLEAADGNDDGNLDISDAVAILDHLFGAGPVLPAPSGTCGADPTADALGCEAPVCP
jgi:hypothetical protein